MTIFDIFSKREKRRQGDVPDIYVYDMVPQQLRVQVVHIWKDAFGDFNRYQSPAPKVYEQLHDALAREYGVFELAVSQNAGRLGSLVGFFMNAPTDRALDVIELSFRCIDRICREEQYRWHAKPSAEADDAITELNERLLEHGLGYAFEGGSLVRKDSEMLHREVVQPALRLIWTAGFDGADQEYRNAHEHHRHGRQKECINDCLKALESTLKTVCARKGWDYPANATVKTLLDVCFDNGLIPSYLQSEFGALRALLESGIPTVRNRSGGHGQGASVVAVPGYLAAYLLHLTGASIVLLIEASH